MFYASSFDIHSFFYKSDCSRLTNSLVPFRLYRESFKYKEAGDAPKAWAVGAKNGQF